LKNPLPQFPKRAQLFVLTGILALVFISLAYSLNLGFPGEDANDLDLGNNYFIRIQENDGAWLMKRESRRVSKEVIPPGVFVRLVTDKKVYGYRLAEDDYERAFPFPDKAYFIFDLQNETLRWYKDRQCTIEIH
jgi:hypothetical protein